MSYLDKLLAGRPVTWKPLGEVAEIKRGKRVVRKDLMAKGSYAVFQNSLTPLGFFDKWNVSQNSCFVVAAGAAGEIGYSRENFWAADDIYYFGSSGNLIDRYLYHFLLSSKFKITSKVRKASIPRLSRSVLERLEIPIPPRDVQEEIVRVLDRFTELEAELETELETELEARQKQYAYYRDLLLTSKTGDNIKWITLGEIGEVCMCKRVLKSQTSQDGEVPFFKIGTFGKTADSFIRRQLFEEYKSKYPFPNKGEILLSASGTIGRAVVFNGQDAYYQDSNIVWLHHDESKVLNRYLYYCYQIAKWKVAKGGTIQRLYNNDLLNTKIPVPFPDNIKKSLEEQERIVGILDRLETLAHSISKGLPRELELRRKQYSYYRDLLLTFTPQD